MSMLEKAERALAILEKINTRDGLEAFRMEYLSVKGILRMECLRPDCECRKASVLLFEGVSLEWAKKLSVGVYDGKAK
jgi:hypothetical protein